MQSVAIIWIPVWKHLRTPFRSPFILKKKLVKNTGNWWTLTGIFQIVSSGLSISLTGSWQRKQKQIHPQMDHAGCVPLVLMVGLPSFHLMQLAELKKITALFLPQHFSSLSTRGRKIMKGNLHYLPEHPDCPFKRLQQAFLVGLPDSFFPYVLQSRRFLSSPPMNLFYFHGYRYCNRQYTDCFPGNY